MCFLLSSSSFEVSGVIYLLLWKFGVRDRTLASFIHRQISSTQHGLCIQGISKWLQLFESVSESSTRFYSSPCLFLFQHHVVTATMALRYNEVRPCDIPLPCSFCLEFALKFKEHGRFCPVSCQGGSFGCLGSFIFL